MAFEKCAGGAKFVEHLVFGHGAPIGFAWPAFNTCGTGA
jgi:hypothetical protein